MLNIKNKNTGFTLIEILISVTIFILIMGSIFAIFYFFVQRDKDLMVKQVEVSEMRNFIDQISKELRNAQINAISDRESSICPNINDTFRINQEQNSVGFILDDKCILYRISKNDNGVNILVRDEEDLQTGRSIVFGSSVLSPKMEIMFLHFNIDWPDQSSITTNLKVGSVDNKKSQSLFYQFTVNNTQTITFNNNYEVVNIINAGGTNQDIYKIEMDSNYIYVIYKDSGVDIYGIDNLEKKGSIGGNIYISEVTQTILYKNYLMIFGLNIDRNGGWYRVIDISPVYNNQSPVQVVRGSDRTEVANFLLIKDNYLYVSFEPNEFFKGGLYIYSISERGNLNLENSFNDAVSFSHHLAIYNNRLYQELWLVGENDKGLREYNIDNPANPLLLNIYKNINPGSFLIKDNLLYAVDKGLQIYDINNINSGRLNKDNLNIQDYNDNIQMIGSNLLINKLADRQNFASSIIINVSDKFNPFIQKEDLIGVDILRGGKAFSKNLNNEIKMLKLFNINSIVEK